MKQKYIYLFCCLFFLSLHPVYSQQPEETKKSADSTFNVKDIIFEHLVDNYEWEQPLMGSKIDLPVIVRDYKGEWHLFGSDKLNGGKVYKGFYIAKSGDNIHKVEGLDDNGNSYRPLDLSITKNVLALFITAAILIILLLLTARWYRKNPLKAPTRAAGMVEVVFQMLYEEVIKPVLGDEAKRFAPYLLTLFFFILTANLMGIIAFFPGGANLTGNISITLVLALCTFVVINFSGTKKYWKETFWPDVPKWLKFPVPIMPVIEVFGIITKPVALMIRLFANMLGGHLITMVLICLIFIFGIMGKAVMGTTTVVSIVFAVFMSLIDLLICFIQAYVFMMLSAMFISLARTKEEQTEK